MCCGLTVHHVAQLEKDPLLTPLAVNQPPQLLCRLVGLRRASQNSHHYQDEMLQRDCQEHLYTFVTAGRRSNTHTHTQTQALFQSVPVSCHMMTGPAGLPGYGGDHHACRQLLVVFGAYDVAAVVAQRDVGGLGVEGTCVCGCHRDDAQVPDVPEGGVQVVDRCPVRIKVTDSPQNNTNRQNTLSNV